jgi:hypothetical protein
VRDRAAEECLRAPWRAFEKDVPVRECSDEQELDRALLTDDDFPNLGLRPVAKPGQIVVSLL